jgi:hypothetical protein
MTREALQVSVHAPDFSTPADAVRIAFDFLDAGDGAMVDVMHTGSEEEDPELRGTLVGVPAGIRQRRASRSMVLRPEQWHPRVRRERLARMRLAFAATLGFALGFVLVWLGASSLLPVVLSVISATLVVELLGMASRRPPFPLELLAGEGTSQETTEADAAPYTVPPSDVFCSGHGDEVFVDSAGNRHPAVGAEPAASWKPVSGARYIWKTSGPTTEEARTGETLALLRTMHLPAAPSSADLTVRVDNEAEVFINGTSVTGLRSDTFGTPVPDILPIAPLLKLGENQIRFVVHNYEFPDAMAADNPAGIAYRLEVHYSTRDRS